MPTKSDPNWRRIKDRVPYHGKGAEDLSNAVKRILSQPDYKFTQKIVMEVGKPHLYIERLVPATDESGTALPEISLHDVIRINKMVEYEDEAESAALQLWEMFALVHQEGFEVCTIAVGDKGKFQKWLGVRIPQTDMKVFGVPLTILGELPADTFVVCGGPTRTADNDEIQYSVKGTI